MTDIPPLTPDNIEERAAWARAHTATEWVPHDTLREDRADGTIILRAAQPMDEVAPNTGHWLHLWAERTPDSVALSERADPAAVDRRALGRGPGLERGRPVPAVVGHSQQPPAALVAG